MNTRVCVLPLSRLVYNHNVQWKWFCSALKPQLERAIDCFELMSKNGSTSQSGDQIDLAKVCSSTDGVSVREVLNKLYVERYSPPKFVKLLRSLADAFPQVGDSFSFKSDAVFRKQCKLFEVDCNKCSPFLLISAYRSLQELNVGQADHTVEIIGKSILQKISNFDGNDMLECLSVLQDNTNLTDTQRDIVKVAVQEIPIRLHDFVSGAAVFKLLRVYDQFDKKSCRKLDLKMAELVKGFNSHYLCKLLCLLAEKEWRNKTLLIAISDTIQNCGERPSLKQTVDMLYALNSLNYPDPNLLCYLTDSRTSEISAVQQPTLISSLLTVCGHLRWRNKEILEACGKWILDNISTCGSREFASYILTAATLNYTSSKGVLEHLIPSLKELKITPSTVWLDVVWSLAILGCVDRDLLLEVFVKDFYEPLIVGDDFRVVSNKLKLMNLKSVLKNNHPECIFSCNLYLDSVELPRSLETEDSKKSVIDTLSHFIPAEKYMYINQCTDIGVFVDAEFIIDGRGKPLPIAKYGSKVKTPVMATAVLPPDAKRVSVLVLTHKDFTLNEKSVTGLVNLSTELLKSHGYVVVQIPYSEFSEYRTAVKRAHYLQEKILTAVGLRSVKKKM